VAGFLPFWGTPQIVRLMKYLTLISRGFSGSEDKTLGDNRL
jgi:hypothetical protein